MSEFKKGDRVKVTIEGEVRYANGGYINISGPDDSQASLIPVRDAVEGVTVEKIEPPVEVFKPGDTVRGKNSSRFTFVVGQDGYFDVVNGIFYQYDHCVRKGFFTSRHYEKVELP